MKRWIACLGVPMLAALAPTAGAAPCAGFTDVDSTSGFCANVEWLKNRQITLGCTSSTLYCPNDAVTRLAMAAFMNRLGTALTPIINTSSQGPGGGLDLDSNPLVCMSLTEPIDGYPRTAYVRAAMSARVTTQVTMALSLVVSINGGAFTPVTSQPSTAGGANRWINASIGKGALPHAVGTTARYALAVNRTGGGTADLADYFCQINVVYHSRTGTTSPF